MAKNSKKTTAKKNITVKEVKKEEKVERRRRTKLEKALKSFYTWWSIGFILPPVGLVLYILWRKDKKDYAKCTGTGALIAALIWLFVGLSFLINTNGEPKEDRSVSAWYNDFNNGETLVTVLASSTCPHCKNLKPIITASSNKYGYKLYFFEADKLSESDYTTLTEAIELEGYEGYVPYTFTIVNKKLTNNTTGEMSDSVLTDFLKKGKVIEG